MAQPPPPSPDDPVTILIRAGTPELDPFDYEVTLFPEAVGAEQTLDELLPESSGARKHTLSGAGPSEVVYILTGAAAAGLPQVMAALIARHAGKKFAVTGPRGSIESSGESLPEEVKQEYMDRVLGDPPPDRPETPPQPI